jgi:2'-hydroxyisoflavone reductase
VLPNGAVVRAGLIVGPHDNVFRLPWWVRRIREGGPVPAPGRPDLGVQIIDARDLAAFLLDLAERRVTGAFNGTAAIGQTTMGELLRTSPAR